jgi:hypothetical protein
MLYFDYEKIAREAQIPSGKLEELRSLVLEQFPNDQMMYELHLLRVCMAIRHGDLHLEDALSLQPAK